MKKALLNTKVTVKLRRSRYKEEWYLIIESYPVYKRGSNRASRVVESINRTISTPIWDKSSIARILPDGSFNYKPKRDLNGIIQCRSTIDQEACIYADNVQSTRKLVSMPIMSGSCVSMSMIVPFSIQIRRMNLQRRMNVVNRTSSNTSTASSANAIPTVQIRLSSIGCVWASC